MPVSSTHPHSEPVAAFLRTFGLIAITTPAGLVGISRDSMFALFGEPNWSGTYDKVPKLARLLCIADNVEWDWVETDEEHGYIKATYHAAFVV